MGNSRDVRPTRVMVVRREGDRFYFGGLQEPSDECMFYVAITGWQGVIAVVTDGVKFWKLVKVGRDTDIIDSLSTVPGWLKPKIRAAITESL